MIDNKKLALIGLVTEALPNVTFRVKLENNAEILAYLSGKMRMNFIRVLVGDKVEVEVLSGESRGRIIKRL